MWQSRRGQRFVIQAWFAAGAVLVIAYAVWRATLLDLDFDYLSGRAGFALANEWLLPYDPDETRLAAYRVGIWNTLRLVVVGIALATILGVLTGLARLSGNWLVSRLATVYIETVRNTPLLVQIFFWWIAVFLAMPQISERVNLFGVVYLSNRALALPWVESQGAVGLWSILLLASLGVAWYARRRLAAIEAQTGRSTHSIGYAALTFLALAVLSFLATGLPVGITTPEIVSSGAGIQQYGGGLGITPQFAAVLVALVTYTATFIAEIVRGSIQSLPRGQSEAAMALGLSAYQRMTLVILPQALRVMIPPLTNQYLNLTKNSSLAIAVGYSELLFVSNVVINNAGHAVPMFIIVLFTYQAMSLVISLFMNWLNSRVQLAGA